MIDRRALMQMAQQDPGYEQGVSEMERRVSTMNLTPGDLGEFIKVLEFVLENPDKYEEVLQAALADGTIKQGDFPPTFEPEYLASLLLALYGLQERLGQRGFARGGRVGGLASMGRGGDTMIAHINPREAAVLQQMGGAGSVNPHTGYLEYKSSIGRVLGAIAPIAVSFIPGLGIPASIALGGMIGGVSSELSGGNFFQGAAMGALGAGGAGLLGGALAPGMGAVGQGALGGALGGAAAGVITGEDPLQSAAMGGVAGGLSGLARPAVPPGQPGFGPGATGIPGEVSGNFGAQPAPGFQVDQVAAGLSPAEAAVGNYQGVSAVSPVDVSPAGGWGNQYTTGAPGAAGALASGFNFGDLILPGLAAASALAPAPQPVQQAVQQLSPEQQEYFNRPLVQWDWQRMQNDAQQSGMSLSQFMAQNWNSIANGAYNGQPMQFPQGQPPQGMARGGSPLARMAYMAGGSGSGRVDNIDAKLSPNEYVIDAETVALLGDGSPDEGANRLEHMRREVRMQKGKKLAKGEISPDARSPLSYLRGAH